MPIRSYRCARSLDRLIQDIDTIAPERITKSDGWIGDPKHRSKDSDHNPWVINSGTGIVTARDITHDPRHAADMHLIAERIIKNQDERVKYMIFDGQLVRSYPKHGLSAWTWESYRGNPHRQHLHISVKPEPIFYDATRSWKIGPEIKAAKKLRRGDSGKDVAFVQRWLGLKDDGIFGRDTENAVMQYQKMRGLTATGIVGNETWDHILGRKG